MDTQEIVKAFRKLRVADISDACDANGLFFQVMHQNMRPLQEGLYSVGGDGCMCGQAYTLHGLVSQYPVPENRTWEDYHRAIDPPGLLETYLNLLEKLNDRV